ncbi:MAG: YncE family protein, partial [Deltaproteobacteria bacterium]
NIGSGPTSGMVSVVDNLPAGLTATAISGTGWSCVLATLTCTRSDVLAAAPAAYPPITVTVDVAANPPAQVINSADVSGGSDGNISNNHADDGTTLPVRLQSFKVD